MRRRILDYASTAEIWMEWWLSDHVQETAGPATTNCSTARKSGSQTGFTQSIYIHREAAGKTG